MHYLTCIYVLSLKKWEKLPHVVITSGKDWDLTLIECEGQLDNGLWFDAQSSFPDVTDDKMFNKVGDYLLRRNKHQIFFFDAETSDDHNSDDAIQSFISYNS